MRGWYSRNQPRARQIAKASRKKHHAACLKRERTRMKDPAHRASNNERAKQWQRNNREHRNRYFKQLRKTNSRYRINHLVSVAINRRVKKIRVTDRWFDYLGYTVNQLERRLRATLPAGATWTDFMEGRLQIDHIKDKGLFKFKTPNDLQFRKAWSLYNLRLLWKRDNLARPRLALRKS